MYKPGQWPSCDSHHPVRLSQFKCRSQGLTEQSLAHHWPRLRFSNRAERLATVPGMADIPSYKQRSLMVNRDQVVGIATPLDAISNDRTAPGFSVFQNALTRALEKANVLALQTRHHQLDIAIGDVQLDLDHRPLGVARLGD